MKVDRKTRLLYGELELAHRLALVGLAWVLTKDRTLGAADASNVCLDHVVKSLSTARGVGGLTYHRVKPTKSESQTQFRVILVSVHGHSAHSGTWIAMILLCKGPGQVYALCQPQQYRYDDKACQCLHSLLRNARKVYQKQSQMACSVITTGIVFALKGITRRPKNNQ